jgi:hypothetical protein
MIKKISMAVLVIALAVIGLVGYKVYRKQIRSEELFVKAKEMQKRAAEAFTNGQDEQAKLYLDSCNYYLNLIEKVSGSR